MKPVLAASVLALLVPSVSIAAVGDIVALVRAQSVAPARPGAELNAGARTLVPDAGLAGSLQQLGYAHVTALGAPTSDGLQSMRLVRLSPDAAPDLAAARSAARALVARGDAIAACADQALDLHLTTPNDSDVALQWSIVGPGDIHLRQAWDIEKSNSSVVIGILDTGVDTGHPDLASKIWTNPGEVPGNSLDDDNNGYVDDVHGWDFGNDDNDPNPEPMFDPSGIDEGFHGTAVAGVAAAGTNNLEGIAGSGWNAKILPLKISNTAGQTLLSSAAEGILYAANKHTSVLNMSVGSSQVDSSEIALFQSVINQAVAANVCPVASAGNDNSSQPVYPAACAGVLAVASTTQVNSRSSFSNWGPWVDVGAPGEGMWTSICRNYPIDATSEFIYEFLWGYDGVRPYMYLDGTSFSSPLTAGVCALVRSRYPSMNALAVQNLIVQTGDPVLYDQPIGRKVNAYQAVLTALAVDPTAADGDGSIALGARPSPFSGTTTLAYRLGAAAHVRLTVVDAAGRIVRALADGDASAGLHTVPWNGANDAGLSSPAGVYFAVLEFPGGRSVSRIVKLTR